MIIKICLSCEKEFKVYPSQIKYGQGKFCSKKCARSGKFASLWKGGKRLNHNGYMTIRMSDHPNAVNGYIFEHRLIMEEFLGRYLTKEEIVHHINHSKLDNRIENLMILGKGEHNTQHTKEGRKCVMKDYWKGKKHSKEAILKRSESLKKYWAKVHSGELLK